MAKPVFSWLNQAANHLTHPQPPDARVAFSNLPFQLRQGTARHVGQGVLKELQKRQLGGLWMAAVTGSFKGENNRKISFLNILEGFDG